MIVAIDGPAGVGKSTIAHRIASEFGFLFLNSGHFYRCVAYFSLKNNISIDDSSSIISIAKNIKFTLSDGILLANGENLEPYLHTHEIDEITAPLSAIVEVREILNDKIRKLYANVDLVCEGRDMTTVVFPHAEVKIYLDAQPEIRALRRQKQGFSQEDYQSILNSIKSRDYVDSNKSVGKLQVASDALYIDTSALELNTVLDKIFSTIKANRREK